MAEAAYHAVPILGLPFILGQGELIRFARDQGRARMLPGDTLLKGDVATFVSALHDLLGNQSYSNSASIASQRLKAVARPYAETAAELVEYAAAVKEHGPFLHTQKMYQKWYQQQMLDVLVVYLVVAVALLVPLWRCCSPLCWRLRSGALFRRLPATAVISLQSAKIKERPKAA
jgi:hypothetical protein